MFFLESCFQKFSITRMENRSILTSLTHILFFLLFPYITFADDLLRYTPKIPNCPSFQCGTLGTIGYPFITNGIPSQCGGHIIDCQKRPPQIILQGRTYDVKNIFYGNRTIVVHDQFLQTQLDSKTCNFNYTFDLPLPPPYVSFQRITKSLTLYRCSFDYPILYRRHTYKNCSENYKLLYNYPLPLSPTLNQFQFPYCSVINLPLIDQTPPPENVTGDNPFALMTAELSFVWNEYCHNCNIDGGQCMYNRYTLRYECYKKIDKLINTRKFKIGAGVGGVSLVTVIMLIICCIRMANSGELKEDEASMVAKT